MGLEMAARTCEVAEQLNLQGGPHCHGRLHARCFQPSCVGDLRDGLGAGKVRSTGDWFWSVKPPGGTSARVRPTSESYKPERQPKRLSKLSANSSGPYRKNIDTHAPADGERLRRASFCEGHPTGQLLVWADSGP